MNIQMRTRSKAVLIMTKQGGSWKTWLWKTSQLESVRTSIAVSGSTANAERNRPSRSSSLPVNNSLFVNCSVHVVCFLNIFNFPTNIDLFLVNEFSQGALGLKPLFLQSQYPSYKFSILFSIENDNVELHEKTFTSLIFITFWFILLNVYLFGVNWFTILFNCIID